MIFRDAFALANSQDRRFKRQRAKVKELHREMTNRLGEEMVTLVEGKTSTKQLRRMGHPFARARMLLKTKGKGRRRSIPALPINRQSGRLRGSFKRLIRHKRTEQIITMGFTAPHAKYVLAPDGTRTMRARGYWREVRRRWTKENLKLRKQIRDVLKGTH